MVVCGQASLPPGWRWLGRVTLVTDAAEALRSLARGSLSSSAAALPRLATGILQQSNVEKCDLGAGSKCANHKIVLCNV